MASVNEDQVRTAHRAMVECFAASHAFRETLRRIWHPRKGEDEEEDLLRVLQEHDRSLTRV